MVDEVDDLIPADEVPPDQAAVAELIERLPAPLTPAEDGRLRELARRNAEAAIEMTELLVEVAHRNTETTQDESNMRAALGHYYMMLSFNFMAEIQRENLTVN